LERWSFAKASDHTVRQGFGSNYDIKKCL
jgi:hypothetical protein